MSDHNKLFDGIAQADNDMPQWYIVSFIAMIIVGVLYFVYYQVINDFTQEAQFAEEIAEFRKEHPEKIQNVDSSKGNPYANDAVAITAGAEIFGNTCAACHKADATGLVGPNLTDAEWLHGNKEKEVFDVIMEGRTTTTGGAMRGVMPPHKASLGADKVWKVVAYLQHKYKNIK